MADRRVCVGVIAGAHGVRGEVRVKSFTAAPEAVADYGPVTDANGRRRFELEVKGTSRGVVLARIRGVEDRSAAEALRGVELYVDRESLPSPEEDEYYHADLVGLRVRDRSGAERGTVRAVHNFGAGDMIEVVRPGAMPEVLPFTRAVVQTVDLDGGVIVIDPPVEVEPEADAGDEMERGR